MNALGTYRARDVRLPKRKANKRLPRQASFDPIWQDYARRIKGVILLARDALEPLIKEYASPQSRIDAEWDESEHPRDENGKFSSGPGAQRLTTAETRSMRDSLKAKITKEEHDALMTWSGGAYSAINKKLRFGKDSPEDPWIKTEDVSRVVALVDSALAKSVVPHDMVVSRTINKRAVETLSHLREGDEYVDPGFMAASAMDMSGDWGEMRVTIPKGAHAAAIPAEREEDEQEILFPRNTRMRVDRIEKKPGVVSYSTWDGTQYVMHRGDATIWHVSVLPTRTDADWDEDKHPRDEAGRFSSAGGGMARTLRQKRVELERVTARAEEKIKRPRETMEQALARINTPSKHLAKPQILIGTDGLNIRHEELTDYVQAHGREWTSKPLPPGVKPGVPNECYKNASLLVMNSDGLDYVEGIAYPKDGGLGFLHGWAVDRDGNVIDNTWPNPEKACYFGVRYEKKAYIRHVMRTGTYGIFGGREDVAREVLKRGGIKPWK